METMWVFLSQGADVDAATPREKEPREKELRLGYHRANPGCSSRLLGDPDDGYELAMAELTIEYG